MRSWLKEDEELASVGVGSRICHGEVPSGFVLQIEVFVVEFLAIHTESSSAVEVGEISSLNHESLDESVEDAIFEVEILLSFLFSSAQSQEIIYCFGDYFLEQLKGDPLGLFAFYLNVEPDLGI